MKSESFIPFGSAVKTSSFVKTPNGVNRSDFSVQDWGVKANLTPYAIDGWWGFCRTDTLTTAGATPLGSSSTNT